MTDGERGALPQWMRRGKSEQRLVERAKILLLADEGHTNQQIAAALKTRTARVSKWRQRYRDRLCHAD